MTSFQRRMTGGFALMAVIVVAVSLIAVVAVRTLAPARPLSDPRAHIEDDATRYQSLIRSWIADAQGHLLSGDRRVLERSRTSHDRARAVYQRLVVQESDPAAQQLLRQVGLRSAALDDALGVTLATPGRGRVPSRNDLYREEVAPRFEALDESITRYVERAHALLGSERASTRMGLDRAGRWITIIALVALILFAALAVPLRRTLLRLYRAEQNQLTASARAREAAESLAITRAESLATTRRIVESALDAVINADAAGRITGWNPEAERVFGWTADEILGRPARDLLVPARYHGAFDEWLPRAAFGGEAPILGQRVEITAVRRDGREIPVEVAVVLLRREGAHFCAFARDISDRRRLAEEIRASEEEYRSTFEHAGVGFAQLDLPAGLLSRVNHKLCEILGYTAEELATRTLSDIRDAGDVGRFEDGSLFAPRVPTTTRPMEMKLLRKDGQTVHALITTSLVRERDGRRPRRALAVIQDLSDLRQAQSALQETERRFQLMADSAPVLVWLSGDDGLYTWFNRPWLDFTGRTMTQEIGRGWMEGVHPADVGRFQSRFAEAFASREPITTEYRLRRHDGDWRWMLDRAVPLYRADGVFSGYIGSSVDISDRKREENQREELLATERTARAEAQEASRLKDEFLATLSHELRTPLQAILGWTRLLTGAQLDAEQTRHGLEIIERNVSLQTRLIEDLLDMSRIIQGKTQLDVKPADLCAVIDAAIEVVRPAATAKNVQITADLEPTAGLITGDAQRLQQSVWNLLSNAIKFSAPGGRVQVRLRGESDRVFITVEDDGHGIHPDFLPHVFDRFRQQDASTTRRQSGLGLGLAIVQHLVELHGGRVTADSPGEGRGSTFTIELPRRSWVPDPKPRTEGRSPQEPAPREAPLTSLVGRRILVVDDEPDARDLLRLVFESQGAQVETARSAEAALGEFQRFHPELVVSDIGLPEVDGYQLIRRIRAVERGRGPTHPAVRAMALTAFAHEQDRELAVRAGFDAHVAKPVEPGSLIAAVHRLLSGAQLREWTRTGSNGAAPKHHDPAAAPTAANGSSVATAGESAERVPSREELSA